MAKCGAFRKRPENTIRPVETRGCINPTSRTPAIGYDNAGTSDTDSFLLVIGDAIKRNPTARLIVCQIDAPSKAVVVALKGVGLGMTSDEVKRIIGSDGELAGFRQRADSSRSGTRQEFR